MYDDKKQSTQFDISWSLDKNDAQNHVFYKKNEGKGKVG